MKLRQHNEKPTAKFRGENEPYYLGLELEVEAPSAEAREKGLELQKRPRHFYAKRDGSLGHYGWELITQPIGKSLWLERSPKERTPVRQFFDLVSDLRGLGYSSHNGGRCGLHIHVCRKAFSLDLRTTNHYYWFSRLINGPLFRKLSQRDESSLDSWCRQIEGWTKSVHTSSGCSRYVATNITNKTVEVRIFRGNLRQDRIRKAIEAVITAIEFARTMSETAPSAENIDFQFRAWVLENEHTFPYLARYLDNVDLPLPVRNEESVPDVVLV